MQVEDLVRHDPARHDPARDPDILTSAAAAPAAVIESPEQIYTRVFRLLRPRTALPEIRVQFRPYANANAQVKLNEGTLLVNLADTLQGAPGPFACFTFLDNNGDPTRQYHAYQDAMKSLAEKK